MLRAEADRIVRGKPGFLGDLGDRSPRVVVVAQRCGVHRDARDLRLAGWERDALVELDQVR